MTPQEFMAQYRSLHEGRGRKPVKMTVEEVNAYLQWCSSKEIDPMRFAEARHAATGWRARYKVPQLANEKFLPEWKEWRERKTLYEWRQDKDSKGAVVGTRSRASAERMRSLYKYERFTCMMESITFGWTWPDDTSAHCRPCPLRSKCGDPKKVEKLLEQPEFAVLLKDKLARQKLVS